MEYASISDFSSKNPNCKHITLHLRPQFAHNVADMDMRFTLIISRQVAPSASSLQIIIMSEIYGVFCKKHPDLLIYSTHKACMVPNRGDPGFRNGGVVIITKFLGHAHFN